MSRPAQLPVKQEGMDKPVVVVVGGKENGPALSAAWLGGQRMVAMPT